MMHQTTRLSIMTIPIETLPTSTIFHLQCCWELQAFMNERHTNVNGTGEPVPTFEELIICLAFCTAFLLPVKTWTMGRSTRLFLFFCLSDAL